MASSAPGKRELGLSREDVEELLMHEAMFLEDSKLIAELEEKGYRLLLAEVRQRKTFEKSFDKLVSKGCAPNILFSGLYYLLRTEKQQTSCKLPGKREIRSLETCLRKGVEGILAFEKKYEEAHRTMVFSHFVCGQSAGPDQSNLYWTWRDLASQAKTPCLTETMLAYAEMLRAWWTPRSDALKTYAPVHNCVYAKMVTGQPQFSIVAELNSSFLGRCIEPATLRKNLSRFQKRNQKSYLSLLAGLSEAHYDPLSLESVKPVNWLILFGDKADKSK